MRQLNYQEKKPNSINIFEDGLFIICVEVW